MKKTTITGLASICALSFASTAQAGPQVGPQALPQATPSHRTLGSLGVGGPDFLKDIQVYVDGRLRAEAADQDDPAHSGLSSSVISLRNRFGFITPEVSGFSLLAEGEHTWILNNTGDYNAFPAPGRSVIADPDNFDLNRLQLTYKMGETTFTVGRQYINHGDQRFIGAIGWRQNDQTFDAATVTTTALDGFNLTYSYVNQVNRIFGTQAPATGLERWHGDVHLFRADYTKFSFGTVSAFAYLMDFDNAAFFSTNTYGVELKGSADNVAGLNKINYITTLAMQRDTGANPGNYEEYYIRGQVDTKFGGFKTGLGFERMTSDGTRSFIFPVGTNHKFGGYADAFLTTPAAGLRDYYAFVGTTCPLGIKHTLGYHNFSTDEGNNYLGFEIDYVGKKKLTENMSVLVKLAHLEGHGAQSSIERGSIQLDYSF